VSLAMRHLLGIEGLSLEQIEMLLDTAESFREVSQRAIKKVPTLRGRTIVNLFFEPSTRTRTSFEVAERRLSADSVSFAATTSSVSKGETLLDTARNIEAMMPDIIILRHSSPGAPLFLSQHTRASIVNAGDGAHEHPTQALLDALTIRQHKGKLTGLRIAIIGDLLNSRVFRSNALLFNRMGASVRVAGPASLMPAGLDELGVVREDSVEAAIQGADVVMMLRIQLERQRGQLFPSVREYYQFFGLTQERVKLANPDVIIMHPGPINRGVEIASDVADGPHSVILEQVTNGVAVRMAVLYHLVGGSEAADEEDGS
jgi:aspartate carbamoyltransferase catalytic subunit